jgi:lysophospholipase L1-like esterase
MIKSGFLVFLLFSVLVVILLTMPAETVDTRDTASSTPSNHNMSRHLVLLGDSIFDNPQMIHHYLRKHLQHPVTLVARGGSVSAQIHAQIPYVPRDATHLVVSVGGNDALRIAFSLGVSITSMFQLPTRVSAFEADYEHAVSELKRLHKPVLLVLPYNPCLPDPTMSWIARMGLPLFHNAMKRVAKKHDCAVLDLRTVINHEQPDLYAPGDPIHPSREGSVRIAAAIMEAIDRM